MVVDMAQGHFLGGEGLGGTAFMDREMVGSCRSDLVDVEDAALILVDLEVCRAVWVLLRDGRRLL